MKRIMSLPSYLHTFYLRTLNPVFIPFYLDTVIYVLKNTVSRDIMSTNNVHPEFYPPGSKVCFLCIENESLLEQLSRIFKGLDFYISAAAHPEEGLPMLRLNRYQAAVIEDLSDHRALLAEIAAWPGVTRRGLNLIVVGTKASSLHQQQALFSGANFYLNSSDAEKMDELVLLCLKEYEAYCQPWKRVLEEINEQ